MPHRYQITVQPLDDAGLAIEQGALNFAIIKHDDLMKVLGKTRDRCAVPDGEAAEFIIGLKVFTEVALRHRKDDLFKDIFPHLGAFMTRLKSLPTSTIG